MAKIIFRLNENGKTPSTWAIQQENVMALKTGVGRKFIGYYPGADTCFVEDIKNKDLKQSKVPLFKFNPTTKHTELSVDENDVALINYLKTHPWYGSKIVVFSKDGEAKTKLSQFEKVEKALDLIKKADTTEMRATALAVLGLGYFSKTNDQCLADLKAKAFNSPDSVITAMEADDYQNRYATSLAFATGIVKTNPMNTAVVWSDGEGVIVHIAQGENALDKLTDFIKKNTSEAKILLQEFQARIEKQIKTQKKAVSTADHSEVLSQKDQEIAELKAKLAEASAPKETAAAADDSLLDENTDDGPKEPIIDSDYASMDIEEIQKLYVEKTGKTLPSAYKTNKDWLIKKLAE